MQHGLLHLGEAAGDLPKDEHDFCDPLIAGETQGCGGGGEGVVFLGGEVVRQGLGLSSVHPVGDLIGSGEVVGTGDDLLQPHLGGKRVPPIEIVEAHVGAVGDAGECVIDRLARHDLGEACLGDGHAG